MPANTKPVDWVAIQRRWRAGESARALADEYEVSHTAINKRRAKGGWSRSLPAPVNGKTTMPDLGERTKANAQMIIRDVAVGVPLHLATRAVGLTVDDLNAWAVDDPDFGRQIDAAEARGHADRIKTLNDAAARGDWRAAGWVLERHRETREEFGQPGRGQGSGPTVILNFETPAPPVDITAQVRRVDDRDG